MKRLDPFYAAAVELATPAGLKVT